MGHIYAISDTEPSSVTLYKTGDDSHINILQFQNLTQWKSKLETRVERVTNYTSLVTLYKLATIAR